MPNVMVCEGDFAVVKSADGLFVVAVMASDGEGNLGVSWGDVYIHPHPHLLLLVQRESLKPGAGVMIGKSYAIENDAYEALKPCLFPGYRSS